MSEPHRNNELTWGGSLAMALPVALLLLSPMAPLQAETGSQDGKIPITTSSGAARKLFLEGQELLDLGKGVEANALFEQAVEKDPAFAYGYLNVANSAASTTEFKDNLDRAQEHLEGKSAGEKLQVQIARTFLNNDAEQRIALAKQLVEEYPQSPRAWATLGFMQGSINQHRTARESFAKALDVDPESIQAHAGMGFSYLFNEPKDFALAKKHMEKMIELRPDAGKGYENLGDVHRAAHRLEKAREAYSKAVEKDPTLAVAQLKKGHIDSILGNIDEAFADYDAALKGADKQSKASYANYRAFTYVHAGKIDQAMEELQKLADQVAAMGTPADQVDSIKIFTLSNCATIALYHEKLAVAETTIEQRNALVKKVAEAVGTPEFKRSQEADIAFWEGRLAVAKGNYERALQKAEKNEKLLEPDKNPRKLEPYHALIGLVKLGQKDYPAAVEHLKQTNLNNIYYKYYLGLALEGAGQKAAAKRQFEDVANWNFNSVEFALLHEEAKRKAA